MRREGSFRTTNSSSCPSPIAMSPCKYSAASSAPAASRSASVGSAIVHATRTCVREGGGAASWSPFQRRADDSARAMGPVLIHTRQMGDHFCGVACVRAQRQSTCYMSSRHATSKLWCAVRVLFMYQRLQKVHKHQMAHLALLLCRSVAARANQRPLHGCRPTKRRHMRAISNQQSAISNQPASRERGVETVGEWNGPSLLYAVCHDTHAATQTHRCGGHSP